jgi:hypothetical protein
MYPPARLNQTPKPAARQLLPRPRGGFSDLITDTSG